MRRYLLALGAAFLGCWFFVCAGEIFASSLWQIPPENRFFVGREKSLEEISTIFHKKHENIVALTGIGGIGKTQLAKKYAHLHLKEYDVVWWFDASKDLKAQFYQLGDQWRYVFSENIPLEQLSGPGLILFIKNLLGTTSKKWLLIFDNVSSYEALEKYLPSVQKDEKKIIVTSRNSNKWPAQIALSPLSETQSISLLKTLAGLESEKEENLSKIVNTLKNHPLSLVQAAALIKHQKLSVLDYLNLQPKDSFSVWIKERIRPLMTNFNDGYTLTTASSLELSLNQLKKENLKAYQFLGLLSLINHRKISYSYAHKIYELLHGSSKEGMDALLEALKAFSFIEEERENGKSYIALHDLIQSFVKEEIEGSQRQEFIKILIRGLQPQFSLPWDKLVLKIKEDPELYDHLKSLATYAQEEKEIKSELFSLKLAFLEYHIYHTRKHTAYERLSQEMESLLQKIGEESIDPLALAKFSIDKVYMRDTYTSPLKVEELGEQIEAAISYFKKNKDKDELLRAYFNKAQYLIFQGKLKDALEVMEQAEPLFEESQNNNYKLLFLFVKGWALTEKGDFKSARKIVDRVAPFLKSQTNIPLVLYVLNMKANILMHMGEEEEGFKTAQHSYQVSETYYHSHENEICAEAMMIMSHFYKYVGKLEEAQHSIEKAIAVYDVYFGGEGKHQDQGQAYDSYGEILEALEQHAQALTAYQTAEKIYTELFKDNIGEALPLGELFKKIAILGIKLKDNNIPRHYLNLINLHFGMGSPYATDVLKYLDKEGLKLP